MFNEFLKIATQSQQAKNTDNKQKIIEAITEIELFVQKYRNVTEVAEQSMLVKALELKLVLHVMNDERDEAEEIESLLNKEFLGVHLIGKPKDINNTKALRGLNLSADLLDRARLMRLMVKQKNMTKPKLLGWIITGLGASLIVLALWLFNLKWIWTPALLGFLGVLILTIGSRVRSVVNSLLSAIAFDSGVLIPGIITAVKDKSYEAIFMAPLTSKDSQANYWGLKRLSFKKAAGDFNVGDCLPAVSIFSQPSPEDKFNSFMPTPVCFGITSELVLYTAKAVISEDEWQCLTKLIEKYKEESDELVVDNNLQKVN